MGKRTPPIDVRDQQTSCLGGQSHPHVDDIAGFEVDLGGRACAFDDDHIVLSHQLVQRLLNRRPDALAAVAPRSLRQFVVHLPEQNHLTVRVALGLEQQRVHTDFGDGIGGKGLKVLGTTNFPSIHHPCVVAHVLRLERRDFQPLTGVVATQRGGQPAFTSTAGGA